MLEVISKELVAKRSLLLLVTFGAVLGLTLMMGLAGCGSDRNGVAATVNGQEIKEQDITNQIESMRAQDASLKDASQWAEYLKSAGQTAEDYRQHIIYNMVPDILVRQMAKEKQVVVSAEELDAMEQQVKIDYETDEEFANMLASSGLTEESYRSTLELSLLKEKLQSKFTELGLDFADQYSKRTETAVIEVNPMPKGLPYDVAS